MEASDSVRFSETPEHSRVFAITSKGFKIPWTSESLNPQLWYFRLGLQGLGSRIIHEVWKNKKRVSVFRPIIHPCLGPCECSRNSRMPPPERVQWFLSHYFLQLYLVCAHGLVKMTCMHQYMWEREWGCIENEYLTNVFEEVHVDWQLHFRHQALGFQCLLANPESNHQPWLL